MIDLTSMNDQLQTIARDAGAFMLGVRESERRSDQKVNAKDLVTVADIKSQNIIKQGLEQAFPDIQVVSEEDDETRRDSLFENAFTGFVIDPIDGTYNFKRDMRESAVSIGYIEGGEIKAGVIYDPYKDEMFTVTRGEGAFRNGVPIHVSDHANLEGASIATSNSYDDEAMERNLRRQLAIYEQTGIMPWMSCQGSGVLIMANIACGRFDAYHHNGLKPWDNAAAILLVQEAGGVVERIDGERPVRFTDAAILAGNPSIIKALREQVITKIDPKLLS